MTAWPCAWCRKVIPAEDFEVVETGTGGLVRSIYCDDCMARIEAQYAEKPAQMAPVSNAACPICSSESVDVYHPLDPCPEATA